MPEAYLSRRETFSASHRLHSPKLSDLENQKLFGKCNHPHGHGHNYILEVTVKAKIDPKTGLVMNLTELKKIIRSEVIDKLDHKHLNLDIEEFRLLNPTAENIALLIWKWLEKALPPGFLFEVKLHETENNVAIYRGE